MIHNRAVFETEAELGVNTKVGAYSIEDYAVGATMSVVLSGIVVGEECPFP